MALSGSRRSEVIRLSTITVSWNSLSRASSLISGSLLERLKQLQQKHVSACSGFAAKPQEASVLWIGVNDTGSWDGESPEVVECWGSVGSWYVRDDGQKHPCLGGHPESHEILGKQWCLTYVGLSYRCSAAVHIVY